jgi:hypothetical protein
MPTFEQWTYTVDREATAKAYAETEIGGSESCECAYCRNFRVARTEVFPDSFLALLDNLAIDFRKAAEVCEFSSMGPGFRHYSGWYHFIGDLREGSDRDLFELAPGFGIGFSRDNGAPRLRSFAGKAIVQIGFDARAVPWRLTEPEPD